MSDSAPWRGRLLLLAAACFWSLSGVLVKSPPLQTVSPLVLACVRVLFATACLLPLIPKSAVRFRLGLLPMVGCFAAMNILFITALTQTTAAAAIFLQYTSTLWAFLFGMAFLGDRLERGNVAALVFGLAGIGWIVASEWSGQYFWGNLIALGSGVMYGGVVICLRELREENSAWLIALNHLVSGAVLLPFIGLAPLELTGVQWMLIAFLGIVQMALPYVLFAQGVKSVSIQEAALIPLIEPLLNPLWVWLVWGEPVSGATWIGGGLILTGLLLRYTVLRPAPAAATT